MHHTLRPPSRWRLTARLAAAVSLAVAVTVTGLPDVETAEAAGPPVSAKLKPNSGKRCDVRNGLSPAKKTPADSGFPDDPTGMIHKDRALPKNYEFDLPGQAYDGLEAPTAAEQKKALSQVPGDPKKNVDAWKKIADASGKPADRAMEIYARFLAHKEGLDFKHWFDKRFIRNQINNHKGSGFEGQLVRDYKLIGPDWLCEVTVELFDKDGAKVGERRYDAYNRVKKEFNEFKSNAKLTPDQLAKDRVVARSLPDHTFRFTGAKKFTKGQAQHIADLERDVKAMRGGKTGQVRGNQRMYNPVPRTTPIRGYSDHQRWFAPGCQTGTRQLAAGANACGTRGPANERALSSGRTLEEARRFQRDANRLDPRGTLPRGGPGGVDFTTLELRYVGGLGKGKGMAYSMKADQMPDPDANPGFGGAVRMQLSSDALFTWLALTPDKFWVNLNPDQPNKVMDARFGRTDAGRVLLEADLEMKRDFSEAVNPDKHAGAKVYWDTAPRRDGMPCFPGVRMWIEPKPAQVREQDGGIYILDAPLKVSTQWLDVDYTVPGSTECKDLSDAEKKAIERSVAANVMPLVEERVNTDPDYADLRAVYTARVAAEYIRQQDAKKATDFRAIIDSDDVSAWPLRDPHQDWTREQVWNRYMDSIKKGIEWFELKYGGKVYNQGVGGVDFSKQPKRNIPEAQFVAQNRDLDTTTVNSRKSDDTSYRDLDTLYLGAGPADGGSDEDPGGDPGPRPTPAPSDTGRPSDPPSPPAPDPTGPGDDGATPPPGSRPDPDGGLADTGSDTPVGLLIGLAAVLAAAGGALTWWMRRRRTASGDR
ncbi:hypothetical protein RB625_15070 [Streptomyces californicus]|uniref:hypothetical protein n=1 Tax=Streptomyces californicus TaxID=67351 RepID=UPI00296F4C3D|nr:hypothetical protein [Streptomyces californicus]MDW4899737.1 hypothetical protein [Streptomyces californicus]